MAFKQCSVIEECTCKYCQPPKTYEDGLQDAYEKIKEKCHVWFKCEAGIYINGIKSCPESVNDCPLIKGD